MSSNRVFYQFFNLYLHIKYQRMVKIIENYTLHEQIGEGQYGKVYRGVDGRNNREVAAKVINVKRFRDNPKLEECTLNQIQVLTRIDSPFIVRFIEILKTVNNFYFFYQFCNGGTLDQQIRKYGCLPQIKLLEYLEQLLEAFKILIANNIMHRDLKPSNILLHNGKIKLGDFGFCKSLENQRDLAQTMLGSPIYMAPEVLRGQIYTIKADLWSLGVVIYEMAYGFCPFQQSSIARLINLLEYQQIVFNKDVNKVSPLLEELMKKILVKDHFKRISWEELFTYSIKSGILMKSNSNSGHQRVLSEVVNRTKRDSDNFDKQSKFTEKNNYFKKKSKHETNFDELHENIINVMKIADKFIHYNAYPQLTIQIALKIYKTVLKEHIRLGSKKQYLKERVELSQAVSQIQMLTDNMQQDISDLLKVKGIKQGCTQLLIDFFNLNGCNQENKGRDFTGKHLQKCLQEASLLYRSFVM